MGGSFYPALRYEFERFYYCFFVLMLSICASAQMLEPAIDQASEPFSYFSHPTDVIEVMDGRAP